MNKYAKETNDTIAMFEFYKDGKKITMDSDFKNRILESIRKDSAWDGYDIKIKLFQEGSTLFKRGKREKRFKPEKAEKIRKAILEDGASIRSVALRENASTVTITRIVRGTYFD